MIRQDVRVLEFESPTATLALRPVLRRLHRLNIGSILVEGGQEVFTQFVRERVVDEMSIFLAPRVLAGGISAFREAARRAFAHLVDPASITVRVIGRDILLNWIVREE